jgi:hypothetical protein
MGARSSGRTVRVNESIGSVLSLKVIRLWSSYTNLRTFPSEARSGRSVAHSVTTEARLLNSELHSLPTEAQSGPSVTQSGPSVGHSGPSVVHLGSSVVHSGPSVVCSGPTEAHSDRPRLIRVRASIIRVQPRLTLEHRVLARCHPCLAIPKTSVLHSVAGFAFSHALPTGSKASLGRRIVQRAFVPAKPTSKKRRSFVAIGRARSWQSEIRSRQWSNGTFALRSRRSPPKVAARGPRQHIADTLPRGRPSRCPTGLRQGPAHAENPRSCACARSRLLEVERSSNEGPLAARSLSTDRWGVSRDGGPVPLREGVHGKCRDQSPRSSHTRTSPGSSPGST